MLTDSRPAHPRQALLKSVFFPAITIALIFAVSFVWKPDEMAAGSKQLMADISGHFGWLYLLAGIGALGFCIWLAYGRYAHVKLGEAGEPPEYSTIHWVAMMFTAGIGAGLVSWGFAEPIYYLATPPFGIEPNSNLAYEWAHMYPLVHWGIIPWAFYVIPAVPIAYALYVRKIPALRISEACSAALPKAGRGVTNSVIDVFVILGIIGGTTTSLGVGVPLVSALVSELTGVSNSTVMKITVLLVWVILFGTSTVRGLKRGIQKLADLNMGLVALVLLAMLFLGPTVFILKLSVNSLGLMLDNFFRTNLWTDPVTQSGFPEAWTIFYWGWWIAFAAFVGLFIGRISRGRTIRQIVLGTLIWGTLGTWTYLMISGGYALHLELSGTLKLSEILANNDLYVMTAKIAANMPLGKISLFIFLTLCVVFYATTMDSAAFVAASVCTKNLSARAEPPIYLRIAWILIMFTITAGLVLSGSLGAVQSMTVISALPLIPILILMCISMVRWLRADHPPPA